MVLEATMIVVDNSESSRNGDYTPTRWEAQADAVHMIFQAKTNANPESSVGLMSMGGTGPEVLVTLTTEYGKLLDGMHRTKIRGRTNIATGIQIAGLALKHRQNKSQRQRIIVFTCSQIFEEKTDLVKLAKKMKKNNVAVDFIAFGDLDDTNVQKLEAFNENVKSSSGEGSHLAIIHPGDHLLSEQLLSSPILSGDGAAPRGGGGGDTDMGGMGGGDSGAGFEFGVDPSADPELALALRMSMEEEKARQEKENKSRQDAEKAKMEGIPEEQPLLDANGDPGSSGGGGKDSESDKKDGGSGTGGDKMDTA